jgi:spermidine synthase
LGVSSSFCFCQVLKHQSVEHVDHVDLDEAVIRTCEEHFPQWGDAWKDPRASLHIADGAQFVRDAADGTYDVIIQDSSDPFVVDDDGVMKTLPSGVLYEEDHICQLHRILKPNGILNIQVRRVTAGRFASFVYTFSIRPLRLFACRENPSMFQRHLEASSLGEETWKLVASSEPDMEVS